jgi:hypothetical protein
MKKHTTWCRVGGEEYRPVRCEGKVHMGNAALAIGNILIGFTGWAESVQGVEECEM